MNMTPVIRQLGAADFKKMLAACRNARERFPMEIARLDPSFEYHIDLPKEQGTENSEQLSENPLSYMAAWLADEKRFPRD